MKLLKTALCLALALLLLAPGAAALAEGETLIFDAQGLAAIADDPAGSYALARDIDLGGADWTPIAFSGTLDGRGHTLYNLRVRVPGADERVTRDGNLKAYETVFAGLFSVLEEAELRDLHLKGVDVELETDSHCFAAALAGYIDHSSLVGCSVEGRVAMTGSAVMVGVGGLAGYGCGALRDCSADVELFYEDCCFEARCEQFMGGALACGIADVDGCTVRVDGWDSCHGYVHNGGLVGMWYLCGMNYPLGSFTDNSVSGQICFFEDNPDRRAYCAPFRGESLSGVRRYDGNEEDFTRSEVYDYDVVLRPERCEAPEIDEEITPAGCGSWGWTRHVCRGCGRAWTDRYTPPAHSAGDWALVEEPGFDRPGLERRTCTVCGAVLGERAVPALVASTSCLLDRHETALRSGESLALTASVTPADASGGALVWTSSDESVARVDGAGLVTAVGPGSAVIRAETADGLCADSCTVTVRGGALHWLRSLFE